MICAICGQPIEETPLAAFRDGHSMGYPKSSIWTEVVPIHSECDDTRWYATGGSWYVDDVTALIRHLATKTWFGAHTADRLREFASEVCEERIKRRLGDMDGYELEDARHISPTMRARVMERDNFLCRRCGCDSTKRRLVVDHIYPVAKGGTAELANLQTLCVACNQGKRDRPPHRQDIRPFGGHA